MIEQKSVQAVGLILVTAAMMLPLLSNNVLAYSIGTIDSVGSDTLTTKDRFGIREIYQTENAGEEWYVNMDNPSDDHNFKNIEKVTFTKQTDGSWEAGGKEDMRLEAWSQNGGWKNVEITAHFKIIEPRPDAESNPIFQLYARGGHHDEQDPCLGSAYKARLYMDGHTTLVKEVNHPAYTDERGQAKVIEPFSPGQWMGFKLVVYNIDNDKAVHVESWVDEGDTGKNWKLASITEDHGGWSVNAENMHNFDQSCGRTVDAIITKPGVLAAFRTDSGTVYDFKDLSVREIQSPIGSVIPVTLSQQTMSANSKAPIDDDPTNNNDHDGKDSSNPNNISEKDERNYIHDVKECFNDNEDNNNNEELRNCLSDSIDQLMADSYNSEGQDKISNNQTDTSPTLFFNAMHPNTHLVRLELVAI